MIRLKYFKCTISLFFLCHFLINVYAEVQLPSVFSDHMVLQRNQPVKIWGWAEKGEHIKIRFAGNVVDLIVKDSAWMVEVPAMKAGGPYRMIITGNNKIVYDDIMIGDVWFCSGQSNMAWTVANSKDPEDEIASADFPSIRLFHVPNQISLEETGNIDSTSWSVCSPKSVKDFSAVAYFFGRNIHKHTKVPIGLINSSWGGTVIETWMSKDAIDRFEVYDEKMTEKKRVNLEQLLKEKIIVKEAILAEAADEEGLQNGIPIWAKAAYNDQDWKEIRVPGLWEHHGLTGLDGVVWFRKTVFIDQVPVDGSQGQLVLGKIDDHDQTWINGTLVGETYKYNLNRNYSIENGVVRKGKNVITVRIEDTEYGGGMYSDPSDLYMVVNSDTLALAGHWKYKISPRDLKVSIELMGPNDYPTLLYNGMVYPFINYPMSGVIWYQGEANTNNPEMYQQLFSALIKDWRIKMQNDSLAFLFVQLPNYMQPCVKPCESEWANFREAQATALKLPFTGMAVTIDIGDAGNIHPKNKQDVGKRLALAARKIVYRENIISSGPMMKGYDITGDTILVEFESVGDGLSSNASTACLKEFQIAGKDREFVWAKAYIVDNNKIKVYAKSIKDPVAVRYAWSDNPSKAGLYNSAGLPAPPFRTDDWR